MFRSYIDQTLSYFDRPQSGVPTGTVADSAAWRSTDLETGDWMVQLTVEQAEAAASLGRAAVASGVDLGAIRPGDLVATTVEVLAPLVSAAREQLDVGLGFALWRGVPVDAMSPAEVEAAFWIVGLLLGHPGAQNGADELLGHVRDYHDDPSSPLGREYRTTVDINFHCDAADVVGLLCISEPAEGGESRIVSSVAVFNELLETRPDLAARLCEPAELDARNDGGGFPHVTITPVCFDGERVRTFMHLGYLRSADRHPGVEVDPALAEALDVWEAIAVRPDMHLDMELLRGDLQLCSNHTIAHARRSYVDDPASPRHLLRLWLSLD